MSSGQEAVPTIRVTTWNVKIAPGLPEATTHLTEAKQGATKLGLLVELTWITHFEKRPA